MRRIIVLEHLSLDGVYQGPGGKDEDTSGGFAHGGWAMSYDDPDAGVIVKRLLEMPFDLLLGRKTYDIWAPYWPKHADVWPNATKATKYIASNSMTSGDWGPSVLLGGDVAEKIRTLKQQQGADLHVWGSGNLVQTLMKHDLIDQFWLMIYPLTLGSGKRLFDSGTVPASFEVKESKVTSKGVIMVNYERVGGIEK